ncbi:MAG TPA: Minf_1886 family protein [Planctomycetaceae bacterium]|nr:Minf_1886 family protein [Planctomycetaceae bacterium]
MSTTQKTQSSRLRYHPHAKSFLFDALRRSQQNLGRCCDHGDERAHITGPELLEGIREFALERFGLMARTVFHCWSIYKTDDFGRMVFDLIEQGQMHKTDSDQLADFSDVFDFAEALDNQYRIDVSHAFS